jgi:hypothetical protein
MNMSIGKISYAIQSRYSMAAGNQFNPLNPLLSDLRPLQLTDLPRFKEAITAGNQRGWYYFFPYLLFVRLGSQGSRMVWTEDQGSICLFKHQYGRNNRLDLVFPPFPHQEAPLRRSLERVNDFNQAHSSWIHFVDAKDLPQIQTLQVFHISQRNPQYLYSPRELSDLKGSQFRTLRRNISSARRHGDVHIKEYAPEYAAQCRRLLASWENEKENKSSSLTYQHRYALNVLHFALQMDDRDLFGHVFINNGQVRAFTFGGEIRQNLGCLFLAIADPEIANLSYLTRQHFFVAMQGCQVVNDGTDGGKSGLKEMKQRFRPCGFHWVFSAKQFSRLPYRLSPLAFVEQPTQPPLSGQGFPCSNQRSPSQKTKTESSTQKEQQNGEMRQQNRDQGLPPPYPKARYELRPSRLVPTQVGLFALMPIAAEKIVLPYRYFDESRLISWEELESLDEATRHKLKQYCYKSKKGIHAPKDINTIGICYFINHSCEPNLYCTRKGDFVALRNIQIDEELTADLEKNMAKSCLEFICSCNTTKCRKIIRI